MVDVFKILGGTPTVTVIAGLNAPLYKILDAPEPAAPILKWVAICPAAVVGAGNVIVAEGLTVDPEIVHPVPLRATATRA